MITCVLYVNFLKKLVVTEGKKDKNEHRSFGGVDWTLRSSPWLGAARVRQGWAGLGMRVSSTEGHLYTKPRMDRTNEIYVKKRLLLGKSRVQSTVNF